MDRVEIAADFKVSADQLVGEESFADEFVCKICLVNVVGCGPQLTKCSHLFCGDCLQEWFNAHPSNQTWAQRAKTGGAVPCPVCKTSLNKETDVYAVEKHGKANSAFLWKMIQGLHIKCNGNGGCCKWRGEYGSYLDHLRCGTCGEMEPEDVDSGEKQECEKTLDEVISDCHDPSTCSEILSEPGLEELGTDSFLDECSAAEESEGDKDSVPDRLCYHEAGGRDLTSLIKDLISLNIENASSKAAETSVIESVSSTPVFKTTAQADERRPKASKNNKSKKTQAKAKDVVQHCAKSSGRCLTAEEVQAHQWQMARYQMAYAQQYHMAVQASRMQQYYQQMRMAAGISM